MEINTASYDECVTRLRGLVDNNPMTPLQIMVVLICFMLNMIDGMDVVMMSYAAPVLADEWAISPAELGAVFSAALVGMTVGCLAIAPYADVIGRKKMILAAVATIGTGMFFSASCTSLTALVIARVFTGLGVGAILASMASMTSEYASKRSRNLCITFLQAGFPIGAVITGFASAEFIPSHGWRFMFMLAGSITLFMLPVVYFWMPESLEFLAKKQPKGAIQQLNHTLNRMHAPLLRDLPAMPDDARQRTSVKALFEQERARPTLLLWTGIFMGFFTLYFIISWIPKIAVDAGLAVDKGIYAGTAYNLGSFAGSIFLGWISSRFGLQKMIFLFFILAAGLLIAFGSVSMGLTLILLSAFLIGVTLNGGFNGFWPMAARLYPTEIRTTGVGWAVGAGRAGAVMGPLVGGYLLQSGAGLAVTFTVFAVPLVISGLTTLLIRNSDFSI